MSAYQVVISRVTKGNFIGLPTTHIDGDDICHSRKGGQPSADLRIKTGILYLLRLYITNGALLAKLPIL